MACTSLHKKVGARSNDSPEMTRVTLKSGTVVSHVQDLIRE